MLIYYRPVLIIVIYSYGFPSKNFVLIIVIYSYGFPSKNFFGFVS